MSGISDIRIRFTGADRMVDTDYFQNVGEDQIADTDYFQNFAANRISEK